MLRHSSDCEPGYTRKRMGRYWAYFDEKGERITDRETIERLNSIGLPPAYTNAWFCADANGHLQATGIDARGRKQYRYHPNFRANAEASKFAGLVEFGKKLPKLRRTVEKHLNQRKLNREAVLAAVVRLLDTQYLRVGNEEYAKQNKSFGATTLLQRHIKGSGNKLKMRFAGKHGIVREVTITDRRLGRVVRRCQELPGQALFQYVNGDGEPQAISSADVNDYIREATGGEFTAKHFRTWGASVIAFEQLLDAGEQQKVSVNTMIEPVAEALGNTVAISRKSYVHPALVEAARERPRGALQGMERPRSRKWLSSAEVGLCKFLTASARKRKTNARA
ncbi:DNA topoisomerase IB [Sphingomonas sp.]|uniref:DNA topoisomerase IB n=1 Tax=Sphingomonas sp. TaxID=28214 RepID=UPI0017D220F6|nr:DNA topoisomerase IB [Sphingomonas sp.]MBA3510549.1 DNA topoisomerase IB [Sphingomonas sp.]